MNSFRNTHAPALSESTMVVRVRGTFVVFHDVNFKIIVGKQILQIVCFRLPTERC